MFKSVRNSVTVPSPTSDVSMIRRGAFVKRRGWREIQGRAPLSESLAAALLLASGWDRRQPLLDPFCGSGTFLVEGAWMATDRAPGLERSFAFEGWPDHEASVFSALREELRARVKPLGKRVIWGADVSREMVEAARHNLERADLAERVQLEVCDARSFSPRHGWNAQVLTNPPFGERVSEERL